MYELNKRTLEAIDRMFSENKRKIVKEMLTHQCWRELPGCENWDSQAIERIHFAVLKICEGDYGSFEKALAQANQDWRDLLMAAGFGSDPESHKHWNPDSKKD